MANETARFLTELFVISSMDHFGFQKPSTCIIDTVLVLVLEVFQCADVRQIVGESCQYTLVR